METPVYRSGLFAFTSSFQEPIFELYRSGVALQRALLTELREFGFGMRDIGDMEETGADILPAQWRFSASLLPLRANLEVRLDGVDLSFLDNPFADTRVRVVHALDRAIATAVPQFQPARRSLTYQGHFELSTEAYDELTRPLSGTIPDTFGTLVAQGVGFYVRDPLFSGEGVIVLDKSVLVNPGLFVQIRCEFDIDDFDLHQALANFEKHLTNIDSALGMNGALGASQ